MTASGAYEYNLGRRFQRVAAEQAGRVALWFDPGRTLTYDALDERANRLARALRDRRVGKGDVVCLSGTKTPMAFTAMLACLKLGAPYAVLDPASPVERLRKILAICRPRAVVAERALLERVAAAAPEAAPGAVAADALAREAEERAPHALETTDAVTGSSPAYIMFTSGSTGIPKGAVMSHANVLNLVAWAGATYGIVPSDVAANVNPLYFDNSVFDFYSTLFQGARLVPLTGEETRDPKMLVEKIDAAGCTQWFSVPSLLMFLQAMKATDGRRLRTVRRWIFGGEGYPKAKLKALFDTYGAEAGLFNVYGPTECTCICSSYRLGPDDFRDLDGLPPLGSIAENFSHLVLDGHRPVAAGEVGELCLLGPNVGLGYYNDAERTSRSFVQNPLNSSHAEVMYRTGDLVRVAPEDGKIHIHGRRDNQVKHMGYRIELEEIEAGLHCLPYVNEAVALHGTARGLSRLSAVVALTESVDDARLRADLARFLPDYMVPSVFHREASLPKNANGKVDRRAVREKYAPGD